MRWGLTRRRGNTKAEKSSAELTCRFFYTGTFNDEIQATDPQPAGFCTCLCLAAANRRHHLSNLSLIAK
ncbi:hypothetical protein BU56_14710 [Escherichia coli O145:H25 str. 07-3858]|nr:hypothetical protein BU56_14710 [Escherichia coli O145:H25 str. 07-3858]